MLTRKYLYKVYNNPSGLVYSSLVHLKDAAVLVGSFERDGVLTGFPLFKYFLMLEGKCKYIHQSATCSDVEYQACLHVPNVDVQLDIPNRKTLSVFLTFLQELVNEKYQDCI